MRTLPTPSSPKRALEPTPEVESPERAARPSMRARARRRRVAEGGIALASGASARIANGAIEVCDREGRLLVRYDGEVTEVRAPAGDLRLAAPQGRVVVEAAGDVVVSAARDLVQHGGRRVEIGAGNTEAARGRIEMTPQEVAVHARRTEVTSDTARATVGEAQVFAARMTTVVKEAISHVEHCETVATRWIQRSREAIREVTDMAEEQLGRAKTVVRESFSLSARRTTMRSEEDTSIDGRRVLLG